MMALQHYNNKEDECKKNSVQSKWFTACFNDDGTENDFDFWIFLVENNREFKSDTVYDFVSAIFIFSFLFFQKSLYFYTIINSELNYFRINWYYSELSSC